MLKKVRFFRMKLPSLRYMTQAGGKLSPELHREFAEWANAQGKKFIVMYGQTEATARMGYLPAEYSIEKYGSVVEKRGPSILNGSICTKAVADTITRALAAVTEEGTARRLKNAKCTVAGKTGTSFATLSPGTSSPYSDKYGRRVYQASFVGFFPAETPKYSIICMIFTRPTHNSFQGGGLPALAVKTVVDEMYVLDPQWGEVLHKTGTIPVMRDTTNKVKTAKNETGKRSQ
jgi:membrane peptidoglycan carboxypeptidase